MTWMSAVARAAGADNTVTPGVLGFVVVALLGVATYLLVRSMNRQIKRIDLPLKESPQDERPPDERPPDERPPDETPPDETPPVRPVSGEPDRP